MIACRSAADSNDCERSFGYRDGRWNARGSRSDRGSGSSGSGGSDSGWSRSDTGAFVSSIPTRDGVVFPNGSDSAGGFQHWNDIRIGEPSARRGANVTRRADRASNVWSPGLSVGARSQSRFCGAAGSIVFAVGGSRRRSVYQRILGKRLSRDKHADMVAPQNAGRVSGQAGSRERGDHRVCSHRSSGIRQRQSFLRSGRPGVSRRRPTGKREAFGSSGDCISGIWRPTERIYSSRSGGTPRHPSPSTYATPNSAGIADDRSPDCA